MTPEQSCRSQGPITVLSPPPELGEALAWHGVGEGLWSPEAAVGGHVGPIFPALLDSHRGRMKPGHTREDLGWRAVVP